MKANQAQYPVRVMCRLLRISKSGFYAWRDRALSARTREDIRLSALIHVIHRRSKEAYGAPTIHAELEDDHDIHVGCKRVARLMRSAGLRGVTPAAFVKTTVADPAADRALDRVDRRFQSDEPDRLWVADITYIPTWAGFLYLAIVLDVWSRRVVGWSMETHLRAELVVSALDMALAQRRPRSVIHHSDRGCQYTSYAFDYIAPHRVRSNDGLCVIPLRTKLRAHVPRSHFRGENSAPKPKKHRDFSLISMRLNGLFRSDPETLASARACQFQAHNATQN